MTLITARQAANLKGVHQSTIIGWIKRPHDPLPAIKVGTQYVIKTDDLTDYTKPKRGWRKGKMRKQKQVTIHVQGP